MKRGAYIGFISLVAGSAIALSGCGKKDDIASPVTTQLSQTHDEVYYAGHKDEANARVIACNKAQAGFGGAKPSDADAADCAAARKNEKRQIEVYVPSGGKAFSSSGGSN